jgi:hypothetical protein
LATVGTRSRRRGADLAASTLQAGRPDVPILADVDDVASGAVKYLAGFPDVVAVVGAFPAGDPNPANAGMPWLFADTNAGVFKTMEGSSAAAVVCADFGGWSVPEVLGTLRFRRLRLDVWVDPLRDAGKNLIESSSLTTNRGLAAFAAVQFRMQRTDPDTVLWGDLVTIDCHLLTDIQFLLVPDGDGLQRGSAYYGVSTAGWTDAAE